MQARPILSVGIDVGTTSTHLTFSRLHLANISRPTEPGRMVVSQREIIYQSAIHFTPLTSDLAIDSAAVEKIVRSEYRNAGFAPQEIETGAVIITGETAKKRNAEDIVHRLSEMAGQFVVASAGPNLESLLAARGSGAAYASRDELATICNIDIGGGTSNFAVFRDGQPIATACLNVGGRFVQLSPDMEVLHVSEAGKYISTQVLGAALNAGDRITLEVAQELAVYAAKLILDVIENRQSGATDCPLLMTPPLILDDQIDRLWLSGGVASTIRSNPEDVLRYGDLGILLGRSLKNLFNERNIIYVVPAEAIRATVIGAGTHTLQLSGSTVAVTEEALPANNIPIIRPLRNLAIDSFGDEMTSQLERKLRESLVTHDVDWTKEPVAVFIPELSRLGYDRLQAWSQALARAFTNMNAASPLIIICSNDVAAALGQQLRKQLPTTPHIVLDGIYNTGGDYIDIGKPVANKQAIPVILKDLIFVR